MSVYNINNKKSQIALNFFFKNAKILAIGIILIITILVGLSYWNNYQRKSMIVASNVWQSINASLTNQASQLQLDAARHFANSNNNSYGALISLALARQYVEQGNFAATQMYLQKALKQTHDTNLQAIINIRLARVQLQSNNVEGALKTLDCVKKKGWEALVEDTRGDAQVIKGDQQAARISYEKALQFGAPQVLMRMKLNNLSI